jgi:hypothetical protein
MLFQKIALSELLGPVEFLANYTPPNCALSHRLFKFIALLLSSITTLTFITLLINVL